jgi:hypothetical protein
MRAGEPLEASIPSTIWLIAAIVAVLAVWAGCHFVWPFIKYDKAHRAAARHLDRVTLEGFDYVGEYSADPVVLSRFWMRRGAVSDLESAVRYQGRILSLGMPEEQKPWVLRASLVYELMPEALPRISAEERRAIEKGSITLIRVDCLVIESGR